MHAHASGPSRTIVPTLRYRDVAAAIDWLCNAFDLERHLVVPGEDGAIHYAQLTFGDGMIMLGPVGAQSAFDGLMTQPADTGGAETQICYLFVEDAAAHCARARAAGAEIVLDIEEEGGRGYSCRDPEGHIWNFGTYDPWKRPAGKAVEPAEQERAPPRAGALGRWVKRTAVAMGVLIVMAATAVIADGAYGVGAWQPWESQTQGAADGAADVPASVAREQVARAREAGEAAEQAAKEARERLARERSARETAERAAQEAREQLATVGAEQGGTEARELRERLAAAERTMAALRNELAAERIAREAADRTTHQMREQLERETSSKEETERARQSREKASKERAGKEAAAKEAAERAAREAKEHAAREATERAAKEAAAKEAAAKEAAAKEVAAKEAREKEAREKKERAAGAKRPAMRRVYSEPQSKSPPLINWFGG